MTSHNLRQYTNENPMANAPVAVAYALAARLSRWGLHNFRYGFAPPNLTVALIPSVEQADETLAPEVLQPNGAAFSIPLNFVLMCKVGDRPVMLSVGLLAWAFAISSSYGFAVAAHGLRRR